ncbi:hypothetical protein CNBG_5480 [Cryptococcus deuterogattii R265]|nr:hypothetical protein CNBG_5480 [Cryptococcus deuterogattii R265]KIR32875.1 hypothetical protein I352_04812 [Cryptococcus deuterogattii MMRL2647]KIR71202.1 hypothetical protein I310_05095 [Cryptococcus deuterogattii CA1014]
MSLSENAKGKRAVEAKPLSVIALDGPPRLSSINNLSSDRVALTGKRADPLIKKGPYHSKVDYNSYHSVENGHEAWFVVAPDLTNDEDHRPVYKSLFSRRRIREYEKSLGYHLSQANPNPDWWDEATKKAAEWIVTHRQVAGLDPSYDLQRSVSLWSSVLVNELRNGLETYEKGGGYNPQCRSLAIVKEDDLGHMFSDSYVYN